MIGCLPTQALAFLAVFVYATHATQAIAFEWKPGLSEVVLCQYVIKRMDIQDPEVKEVADTEVDHLSSLKHRHIVSYKEGFVDRKYLYLVMEYCEGGDLAGVIQRQSRKSEKLSELQILDWTLQICLGLKVCKLHCYTAHCYIMVLDSNNSSSTLVVAVVVVVVVVGVVVVRV